MSLRVFYRTRLSELILPPVCRIVDNVVPDRPILLVIPDHVVIEPSLPLEVGKAIFVTPSRNMAFILIYNY